MRYLLLVIGLSALCSGAVSAQSIYKTVDEQGRVSYSDKPPANRNAQSEEEQAELPPVNAIPEQPIERRGQREPSQRDRDAQTPDYQVRVLNPIPESSVPPGQRDLSIVATLNQSLEPEHELVYYMDGERLAQTRERQFLVQQIYRGSHIITVQVVDVDGRVLARSEPVTVHVHRPSVINRPGS